MRKYLTGMMIAATLLMASGTAANAAEKDIVDTAVGAGSFKTLAAALQAADLVEALKGKGPFTVFAPTDEAFAKLPKGTIAELLKPENKAKLAGILTYHVVSGEVPAAKVVKLTGAKSLNGQQVDIKVAKGKVSVDSAQVVTTDIKCSNGIIHVIDSVILPADKNLVEVAIGAGSFKTLVTAAKAAGLVPALTGKGPLTVFAPTDEAFAKIPKETIASLLKPENKAQLAAILKYHVVAGRVYSTDAVAAKKATTLEGGRIRISVGPDGAKVNDAKLVATDIDASNGVIHVIDTVIMPPQKTSQQLHPRRMIEVAIREGAPLYNAGHAGACTKIYMSTVEQLLEAGGVGEHMTHTLNTALTKSQSCSCVDTNAWTLRRALDSAYASMASAR